MGHSAQPSAGRGGNSRIRRSAFTYVSERRVPVGPSASGGLIASHSMSEHLKAHKEGTLYFCTLTVVGWADVFTRARNAQVILESLAFCQGNKGLELFAYCLMPSHLHLIARVQLGRLSDVLRDFKSFTAKRLLDLIANEPGESRKEWLMRLFREAAQGTKQNQDLMFWQKSMYPIEITHPAMYDQKVGYIHNNPVNEGLVTLPEHYAWSSAHPESPLKVFDHDAHS